MKHRLYYKTLHDIILQQQFNAIYKKYIAMCIVYYGSQFQILNPSIHYLYHLPIKGQAFTTTVS